ncbi:hypothetical protein C6Y14_22865 [Streptomyces dioscori]|uniref:TauD/TfdA-like domain-containing protein n=1 Tax=Streptomyces dioscori TaxID=2109333 RepID=A0A2P8Q3L9_9ACTN|nr:TauD/TfdA family dioxygenase [Streptomyces dioscori]PSM40859.1 hypothetical protein C6Y14_22865 [Streptomyces dioscori]
MSETPLARRTAGAGLGTGAGVGTPRVGVDRGLSRALLSAGDTAALSALLHDGARHPDGYAVFALEERLDEYRARDFVTAATGLLGAALPQDARGALLRDVRDRGMRLGEGATGRYSDSRDGGNLHTDGPHMPGEPPDRFLLYCVHQAADGGELVLLHRDALTERLSPDAVRVLGEPFHFDRRGGDAWAEPTVVRGVLTPGRISYLRAYITIGHRHPHVPDLTAEQLAALDELDSLLDDPRLWRVERLSPGEFVVVDNRLLCHGRTAFRDTPEEPRRLMLRTWIREAARTDEARTREARGAQGDNGAPRRAN